MKTPSTDAGRLAQALILAVLAAGMLPAQLFGGLLFALEFRRTPMPALTGGGLMLGLGVCSAIAVFLPMALLPRSRRLLRRPRFVLAGAALGALAMAIHEWPGAIHGPLLQRLRYVGTFDVISYGLTVLAAGAWAWPPGWPSIRCSGCHCRAVPSMPRRRRRARAPERPSASCRRPLTTAKRVLESALSFAVAAPPCTCPCSRPRSTAPPSPIPS